MKDPLENFDWETLHSSYDGLCKGFNANSQHLSIFYNKPPSDRKLYYALVNNLAMKNENSQNINLDTYKALLYWKLYS